MGNKNRPEISGTADYYEKNADDFIASTIHANVSGLYEKFEKCIPAGCRVLDLGCGSGRDSRYFAGKGYDVTAVDPSVSMCEQTRKYAGVPVYRKRAEELTFENEFDAVWACASLLHVAGSEQTTAMRAVCSAMRTGGVLYASWKYGDRSRTDESGRTFTDLNEKKLGNILKEVPELRLMETWITTDVRPERRTQKWLNALIKKCE